MLKTVATLGAATLLVGAYCFAQSSDQPAASTQPAEQKTVTPSGLTIIEQGSDDVGAQAGDRVTVHYTGRLENGTIFDSSMTRGQPFTFTIDASQVIKGWDEGVKGMKCGQKRQLIVPAELGYGSRKMPGIPANSTLVFDVQVLFIARGDPAKPAE